jgi:regulator of protease activity HflC (stomatin/prohibitin superfamily)
MGELLSKLLDYAAQLAPVRIVPAWCVGLYMVAGKCRGVVGPGLKLVVPGLCQVIKVATVPEVYLSPLQTVTLRDGSTLTYSASVTVVVTDARRAYLELGHYTETVQEIAAAILSQELAAADVERFDPARGKRNRLLEELRLEINDAISPYGLVATALRLNNFVRGVRTVRLLLDRAVLGEQHRGV